MLDGGSALHRVPSGKGSDHDWDPAVCPVKGLPPVTLNPWEISFYRRMRPVNPPPSEPQTPPFGSVTTSGSTCIIRGPDAGRGRIQGSLLRAKYRGLKGTGGLGCRHLPTWGEVSSLGFRAQAPEAQGHARARHVRSPWDSCHAAKHAHTQDPPQPRDASVAL